MHLNFSSIRDMQITSIEYMKNLNAYLNSLTAIRERIIIWPRVIVRVTTLNSNLEKLKKYSKSYHKIDEMRRNWTWGENKLPDTFVQNLMKGVKRKVREFGR